MVAMMAVACLRQRLASSQPDLMKPGHDPAFHILPLSWIEAMNRLPRHALNIAAFGLVAVSLAACQSEKTPAASSASQAALPVMERVALGANACWFKSGDPAFKAYRLAPELNSFSGRPRILLVPRNSPESRPMLVVQAEGNPAKLAAFGPVMDEPHAARISTDIKRWANGGKGCS